MRFDGLVPDKLKEKGPLLPNKSPHAFENSWLIDLAAPGSPRLIALMAKPNNCQ